MSENDFLSRWSRLKREAAKPAPPAGESPPPAETTRDTASRAAPDEPVAPLPTEAVELPELPSLDSITGATDITGFLQRSVPEDLRRSALRKAWSSDPAIRDFIGLSENAWDFNDPTAIPGFGPIGFSADQVREMAKKLVGDVEEAVERIEGAEAAPADEPALEAARADGVREQASDPRDPPAAMQQVSANPVDVQDTAEDARDPSGVPLRPRRHGGALPR